MDRLSKILLIPTSFATLAGFGLGQMTNVLQPYWPDAPHWVFALLFWSGAALTVIPFLSWLAWLGWKNRKTFSRRFRMILGSIILIAGCVIGIFGLSIIASEDAPIIPPHKQPDPTNQISADRERYIQEREKAWLAERDADFARVLADPRYSAETKLVIQHKRDLLPLQQEYRSSGMGPLLSATELKSPKAVEFFNRRLREIGKDWQITPENINSVFGNAILNSTMNGPFSAGVRITGGGGNTFDQIDIGGAAVGVDLKDTRDNTFSNTRINQPPGQSK
ncbi:hypothetical protein [Bradyrhizobium liaoningense]|uniref:hypothetical protein n=1 Tax=Bradyrhizobium liaoningense TaxID=43992 RepID=UPI001BAC2D7D|nr:hypothetical protein [Bradyrhizobium liaoningense]MBR0855690.1 hypothetical protein [Bradyrhizobium liaoningense]